METQGDLAEPPPFSAKIQDQYIDHDPFLYQSGTAHWQTLRTAIAYQVCGVYLQVRVSQGATSLNLLFQPRTVLSRVEVLSSDLEIVDWTGKFSLLRQVHWDKPFKDN
jgi:hypothetical protein